MYPNYRCLKFDLKAILHLSFIMDFLNCEYIVIDIMFARKR